MFNPRISAASLLIVGALASAVLPALAGDYESGSAAYNRGDYATAKAQFLRVVGAKPMFYQAHYQLANTFLRLKQYADAGKWYTLCLYCHPDAQTAANCRKAIAALQSLSTPAPQGAPAKTEAPSASAQSAAGAPAVKSDAVIFAETRRREILADGQKRAQKVKEDAEKQIADIAQNGNYWIADPNTGYAGTGVPTKIRNEIMQQAAEKENAILEEARKHADSIQIPSQ